MTIWPLLATQVSLAHLKTVPMDFPCPKTWGLTLESSLQLSPNRNYILWPFWGFQGHPFFNFFGVQTRFWPTYDYVLWMAYKNRYLGPFKVVPRSSRRSLMSQTFMTLFFTKFQHTRLILQFRLSKIFFFSKTKAIILILNENACYCFFPDLKKTKIEGFTAKNLKIMLQKGVKKQG